MVFDADDTEFQKSSSLTQRYLIAHGQRILATLWGSSWTFLLFWGWSIRNEDYISASSGLGYYLGITGGGMVLLLLTYSLRKRFRFLQNAFHLRHWFRVHMVLGVLGPTCILFHSDFSFGSLNSSVALVCLLAVSGSGLVGRFLYNRVHSGVYGEKIKLAQVRRDFIILRGALLGLSSTTYQKEQTERVFEELEDLMVEQSAATFFTLQRVRDHAQIVASDLNDLVETVEMYHEKHPESHKELAKVREDIHDCAHVMLAILDKLPGLHLFERMFSLWHVVHLPIFGLMLLTAVTHVIVVHMY